MKLSHLFIVFLLLCPLIKTIAQDTPTVRGFVGVAGYLDGDFENSLFVGVNVGAEFNINHFIMPQLDTSYFYGSREDETNYGNQGQLLSIYSSYASAINFNFCPKICIGNDGNRDTYLVILPKYSFSKVTAVGNFTALNANDIKTTTKETITDWEHSLGIGMGIDISLSDENSDSLSLNIYYENVPMSKPLEELNHGARIMGKNALGAGINYYFSFKKSVKPSPIRIPNPM